MTLANLATRTDQDGRVSPDVTMYLDAAYARLTCYDTVDQVPCAQPNMTSPDVCSGNGVCGTPVGGARGRGAARGDGGPGGETGACVGMRLDWSGVGV